MSPRVGRGPRVEAGCTRRASQTTSLMREDLAPSKKNCSANTTEVIVATLMKNVLLAWIGKTDLRASEGDPKVGAGPIANALGSGQFDHIVLLNNYSEEAAEKFESWLAQRTDATIKRLQKQLTSPTNYTEIYKAATAAAAWTVEKYGKKARLTFHLSPGTPAMAAIWIIIAKTQFDADLIESSAEHGAQPVDVPFELSAEFIPDAVRRANEELARVAGEMRPESPAFGDICHRSAVMKQLLERAQLAAAYTQPVLILGESGTGKELLAAAMHGASDRRNGPLKVVNCGAIPRELMESEFFGHSRGAFTSADRERKGLFEEASGGTLFLDEIGELPLDLQVKLLRAIQEGKVARVGTSKDIKVDVRIVAATNRDLMTEVAEGRFREDLFYRLAVIVLDVPPLREREGDVGLLLELFMKRLNQEAATAGRVQKKLSPKARNLLLRHPWPGNVRELEATLVRATIWSKGPVVEQRDVQQALLVRPQSGSERVLDQPLGDGFSLQDTLDSVARHYIGRALNDAGGVKTKAAELVGFKSYQRLTQWMDRLEVKG